MRRTAAVALLVIGSALPLCAQHGGSHGGGGGGFHGGFSGHSAPAFHGGFSSSAPSRPAAAPRFSGAPRFGSGFASRSVAPNFRTPNVRNYGARPGAYPNHRNPVRPYRPPYRPTYGYGGPYWGGQWYGPWLYPWDGWGDSDSFGGDDDSGYDATPVYPNYADDGYQGYDGYGPYDGNGNGYGPQGDPGSGPYQPSYAPPQSSRPPESRQAITLIFKDGRPAVRIHNYLLSRDTLTVLDGRHRDIPVNQLDLAATENANREAGVDFQLPGAE